MPESNRTEQESRAKTVEGVKHGIPLPVFQGVLSSARQLTLDGREEPLFEQPLGSKPSPVGSEDPRQLILSPVPEQLKLSSIMEGRDKKQIHQMENGKANPDCFRDKRGNQVYRARVDPSGKRKTLVFPCTCGRKNCQSSEKQNSAQRTKNVWDGTARKGGEKIGLRHALGHGSKMLVGVVTLSERLLLLSVRMGLEKTHKALRVALHLQLRRMLAAHVYQDVEEIIFYEKAYFHPTGDKNPDVFRGHWNFIFGNYYFSKRTGTFHRFNPFIPEIGKVMKLYVQQALEDVFGSVEQSEVRFEPESPDKAVVDPAKINCHWQFVEDEGAKRHLAYYVPRLEGFSQYGDLCLRPVTTGLAHPKNRDVLKRAIRVLKIEPLPEYLSGQECVQTARGYSEEQAQRAAEVSAEAHRAHCAECSVIYTYFRQTMEHGAGSQEPLPPFTGPPDPVPIDKAA